MPDRRTKLPQMFHENLFEETDRTRLLEAVMERGIRDAIGLTSAGSHLIQKAREWILDESKNDLTFLGICEELSITDRFIRRIRDVIRPFVGHLPILVDNDLSVYPSVSQIRKAHVHNQLALYKVAQCRLPRRRRGHLV